MHCFLPGKGELVKSTDQYAMERHSMLTNAPYTVIRVIGGPVHQMVTQRKLPEPAPPSSSAPREHVIMEAVGSLLNV
jgi:hypothetical protein